MTWVEKYRPTGFNEVIGQNEAIEKVVSFLNNFGRGKKAILLHVPPGTGQPS